MNADTIAKLAWYKTRDDDAVGQYYCGEIKGLSREQMADIMHYAECHRNLQFGWDFAEDMANKADVPFPACLQGDDLYVWRAYQYIKGADDPVIAGAVALNSEGHKNIRNQVKALLVSEDVTHEFVAHCLNISLEVIKAFEKLFFNVIDRKHDHAFIANVVFPQGRMVEAMENYLEETGIGDLMMRTGLTNGKEFVLYAAGLGAHPFGDLDAVKGAERMDKQFMTDGLFFALSGWQHQRRNAMPILNARLSMQASKMGAKGDQVGGEEFSMGDCLRQEIEDISLIKARAQSAARALELKAEIPANLSNQQSAQ